MDAEEMFKKLGYKKTHDNDNFLIYSKSVELMMIRITFNKLVKYINKVAVIGNMIDSYLDITYDEIPAINKQIEELGGLN